MEPQEAVTSGVIMLLCVVLLLIVMIVACNQGILLFP